MTQPYAERLLKLAAFLAGPVKEAPAHCALDLLPCVFPQEWRITRGSIALKEMEHFGDHEATVRSSAVKKFFDLKHEEVTHLFLPMAQDFTLHGGAPLHLDSTLSDLSEHIRSFVKRKTWS